MKWMKWLCLLLALSMLTGCGSKPTQEKQDTLVVGTTNFDGKFSPFFYTNATDNDVISLVHLRLLETDREGSVVLRGASGEIRAYNGTDYTYRGIADCEITEKENGNVWYDFTLRQDVTFSDGSGLDADDVIFSFYVTLDPDYDGALTVYSLPILGLESYRAGDASRIEGIEKTGQYSLRVVLTEISAPAIHTLAIPVVPMHYYGSPQQYDYESDRFGFSRGDLSGVRAVTAKPMGGGPYKFVSYTGGTVTLEANENYWRGAPKIRTVQFREGQEADKVSGVVAGTVDLAEPSYATETVKAIQSANGGALSGDVISARMSLNPGYGYVGISAKNVRVDEPGSMRSKALRKALATVIAVYRDVAVDSYYGQYANVIQYPISDTSWAAPRVTDPGYRQAFSVDGEGRDIYAAGMTDLQRYDAAKTAALGYFRAAGYTVDGNRVVAAPEGAKMEYEVLVGAGGTGDHPTFMALSMASKALGELGFSLIVTDLSNFSELTGAVHSGTAELFAMAWTASADPDMYQVYHSLGSSSQKTYQISDPQLDELILLARQSMDQEYRRTLYGECLRLIADWAVEIPMYQRQNLVIFSGKRVDMDTVTPDMTTFWNWENDIEKMQMK